MRDSIELNLASSLNWSNLGSTFAQTSQLDHGKLFRARRRFRPCLPCSYGPTQSSRMGRTVSSTSQVVEREFLSPHSPVRLRRKLGLAWQVRRCFRLRV